MACRGSKEKKNGNERNASGDVIYVFFKVRRERNHVNVNHATGQRAVVLYEKCA